MLSLIFLFSKKFEQAERGINIHVSLYFQERRCSSNRKRQSIFLNIITHPNIQYYYIMQFYYNKFFTLQSTDTHTDTDTHSDSLFSLHSRLKCTSVLDLEILLSQKLYPFNLNHRKSGSVSKNFTSSMHLYFKNIPQFMIAFTWRCPFLYTQYSRK